MKDSWQSKDAKWVELNQGTNQLKVPCIMNFSFNMLIDDQLVRNFEMAHAVTQYIVDYHIEK
jgi:hypothetical protein